MKYCKILNIEISGVDPLDNSNLCDILMLERALETEAHVSATILIRMLWCGYPWFESINPLIMSIQLSKLHILIVSWYNGEKSRKMIKISILRPHMEHTTGSTRWDELDKKLQKIWPFLGFTIIHWKALNLIKCLY